MPKFVLSEDEKNINLYGIASHSKAYQLVWHLNQDPLFCFEHGQYAMQLEELPKVVHHHPYYHMEDDWLHHPLYLIVNYQNGRYLLPALKHAHYLLLTESDNQKRIREMTTAIKKVKGVLTVFELNQIDKNIQEEIRLWVS